MRASVPFEDTEPPIIAVTFGLGIEAVPAQLKIAHRTDWREVRDLMAPTAPGEGRASNSKRERNGRAEGMGSGRSGGHHMIGRLLYACSRPGPDPIPRAGWALGRHASSVQQRDHEHAARRIGRGCAL